MTDNCTTYRLIVQAACNGRWPNDPVRIRRLRALAKRLIRSVGLRCVEIKPTNKEETGKHGKKNTLPK